MKKLFSILFVAALLLLAMIPAWGTFLAGSSDAGANERLAPPPSLHHRDGSFNWNVLTDTMSWLNDHFFLRQELISAQNKLNTGVFSQTDNPDVMIGKDGWLFFGSTLDDYTGINALSDRELFAAARNLQLMQEYCQSRGKTFAFTIAPNKNSLYGQFMPDFFAPAQKTNAQRLAEHLNEMGVSYIDLFAAFRQQEDVLYFAHDSHWNSRGAALGADTINKAFGIATHFFEDGFSDAQPHTGDLYEMLYPAAEDSETDPVFGGTLSFTYEGKNPKPDSITLKTTSQAGSSLLCYRDSFGNLLHPYLASSFGACRFSRSTAYDLMGEEENVLIELVERNIPYLLRYTPVFPAPERTAPNAVPGGTIGLELTDKDCPEGYQRVNGTLPETPDTNSPIYVVTDTGYYEATMGLDNQFDAYLPADSQVLGAAYQLNSGWIQRSAE